MTTPTPPPATRIELDHHLSLREAARKLSADGIPTSHQWLSRLSMKDPTFPPVIRLGRSLGVDYRLLRPYMEGRPRRTRNPKST